MNGRSVRRPYVQREVTAAELADLYHCIGAAIWHVQYLEDVLVSFVTIRIVHERRCAGEIVDTAAAEKFLKKNRRLTLGPLLKAARQKSIISPADEAEFESFKEARHWLVHRSMVGNGDDLYFGPTRVAFFRRVQDIQDRAILLGKRVAEDMGAWASAHGVDPAEAERQAAAKISKLRGA